MTSDSIGRNSIPDSAKDSVSGSQSTGSGLGKAKRSVPNKLKPAAGSLPATKAGDQPAASNRQREAATKCVYFNDSQQLSELEALAAKFPRGSVSSIIQQLVVLVLKANRSSNAGERTLRVDGEVYL